MPRETAADKAKPLFRIGGEDECWPWLGRLDEDGYGRLLHVPGQSDLAHRLVYRLLKGPIPPGLQLDHTCRYHACVNPAHLDIVTNAENARRGADARGVSLRVRERCHRDHPVSEENTYYRPNGRAECRLCRREMMQAFYAKERRAAGNGN